MTEAPEQTDENVALFEITDTGWKCDQCGRENTSVNTIRHTLLCPIYGVKIPYEPARHPGH